MTQDNPGFWQTLRSGYGDLPVLIAGPCVIESRDHVFKMAEIVGELASKHGYRYVFKASFDKANRSSVHSYRGPGMEQGLKILRELKETTGLPVLTDIHGIQQVQPAAHVADIIQIPAFLCRQTDLYIEAGKTDTPVNVKKGQFMSAAEMANVVEKARVSGIRDLSLTERGSSYGYQRLIVDFVGFSELKELGVPVVFDGTHSIQLPGAAGTCSGGNRKFVPNLCRAAAAVGCEGLFLEVHDDPDQAKCDGPNMITPGMLDEILRDVKSIRSALGEQ